MKQILVCYKQGRKLRVRCNILTDVFVPLQDIISPQKTTFIVPKNDLIELSDIIIIKDNDSSRLEYIGYIDTLVSRETTVMSCYPLINIFDNDFVLDQMYQESTNVDGTKADYDVDAVHWLATQIKRAFIDTEDDLQALPLIFPEDLQEGAGYGTKTSVLYKKALDTANLLEAYVDLFINTGVYVVFTDLVYEHNEILGILCEIKCNKDERQYRIYEHDPSIQNVEIIDHTFTSYNKIIATEEIPVDKDGKPIEDRDPQRFYFYLLNNNDITRDATDSRRIKQVRSKAISFSLASNEGEEEAVIRGVLEKKWYTDTQIEGFLADPSTIPKDVKLEIDNAINESRAKALILAIYNELQAPDYDLKIEIEMLNNDNLFLYRKVDFVSNKEYNEGGVVKNVVYTSNITRIERLNDMQVRITLGALRNSLTDFKKKVEVI